MGVVQVSRGILYTMSLVMLALSVFAFASVITSGYESKRAEEAQLFSIDRAFYAYRNIEHNVRTIFNNTSGITVYVNDDMVSFKEDIPNTNDNEFTDNIQRYESFVESSEIDFDTNELTSTFPIEVDPFDAIYTHDSYGGDAVIFNSPQAPTRYRLHITVDNCSLDGLNWDPYSSGSLPINIYVNGLLDNNETTLINPVGLSVANLTLTANQGTIILRFEGGNMTLTSYAASTISVQTNVTVGTGAALFLPSELKVWQAGTGVSKNSTIRVM